MPSTAAHPSPATGGPPHCREITTIEGLEAVRPQWAKLAARAPSSVPYTTPEFMLPWLRSLDGPHRLRAVAAWDADRMVGLAPLVERRRGPIGARLIVRSFPVRGTPPPFEFLIEEGRHDVAPAFFEHWRRSRGWDLLELRGVPSASPTAGWALAFGTNAHMSARVIETAHAVFVPVAGPWGDYMGTRSTMHRQNCRRALRRCEAIGPTRLARYPGDLEYGEARAMAGAVVGRSWKRPGDDGDRHEKFFTELAAELRPCGALSLRFLLVRGSPIGCLFEIRHANVLHAFHIAYDLAFQHIGVGVLLLGDGIRAAHDLGLAGYDLGGDAEYLRRWSDTVRPLHTFAVARRSVLTTIKLAVYERIRVRRAAAARRRTDQTKEDRKADARRSPRSPASAPPEG